MTREPGTTIAEKLGASAGAWAVLWLGIHYLVLQGALADPSASGDEYARALLAERMTWEWATALRVMGGVMIVWFMGSLAGRLRLAEGEPGRLASISFGIGVVWGAIWLLSAMFNSAAILLASQYQYPEGARLAGALAQEMVLILTPSIIFTLALATSFVALRFGGFPKAYSYATAALTLVFIVLAIVDWYGPGNLGGLIMTLALGWTAVTSALIIPNYRPPDIVRGTR
ncbi:MAG: hypothetical protein ACRD2A_08880 [Vicinamibacterales bacterium]